MNEEQQKLYDVLVRDGYYTKSFEEFQTQFQDSAYQDKVFGVVQRDGLFTKGKDSFLEKYAVAEKKKDDTEFVSEVGSSELPAVEGDGLLARHDSLEQTYMDAWKRMQDIQALDEPTNQQIQELQELNTTFTTALNEYNQIADQIRSEAPKSQDPAERVRSLRRGVSRKNEDGGRSTVKMADMEVDGKFVAVPTLFPKDPNNYGPNPEDWVEFGEDDAMGAYEMALERGEVFEFDTPEGAREFAKGSWKEMEEEPPKDEFNKSLEFVNNRLIDRSDAGQVARELEYEFGEFGFNFDRGFEVGIGNYITVTAANGETIDVNTNPQFLTDEDTQADLLRDFLVKNRGTTPKREVEQSIDLGQKELDRLKGVYEQTHGDYERAAAKVEEYRQKVQADESVYDEAEAKRLVEAVNAAARADQKAVDEYNAVLNIQNAEIDELNRIAQEKRDEPDAFERAFGKNAVTDLIADNTYRPIIQGQAQAGTIRSSYDLLTNANDVTDEDIAEFLRAQAVLEEYGPSDEMRDFQRIYQEEGGGWGGFVSAFGKRPPPLGELFVSSVSMMANKEVAKGAFLSGLSLAPTGLFGGPLSGVTVPAAFLTGAMGGAGATLEAGISFAEFLRDEMAEKQGVDPEKVVMNNENIREVLSDPEAMSRIRYRAGGRGIAIGVTSLIGAGVAAAATRRTAIKTGSKLKAAATGAAVELPFEGLGETAGQLVAGQEMDAADIGLETFAGGPAQVVGVGIGLSKAPQYTLNGELVTGKQMADFIREADEADVAGATIEIKNDDTLAKQAHTKRDDARERVVIKEQLRKSGVENEETVDKLADLELEKRKLKGLETTAAERKRTRIQNEIDAILDGDSYFFEETTDEQGNKRSKEVRVTRRDAILALLEDDIVNPTEKEIEAKQAELFRDALADIQESDAVQESSTEEVDVGEQAEDGEEVGVGDTEEEVVDEEAEELEAAFEAESTPDVEEDIDGVIVRRREGYEFGRKAQRVLDQAKKRVKALENFGVKIVLHENDAQYGAATGKGGRGVYLTEVDAEGNVISKTIHINLDKANSRTVAHEAFHALFLERVKGDDAKAQQWAKATMKSVRKALDADSVLATRIDDFLARYEENVIDEEALAEIFGYLSEGYGELTGPQQSKVKEAIKKLIELITNIKLESQWSQDDQNVIDVLNTLAGKMERGETITEEELAGLDVSKEKAKEVAEETTVDSRIAGLQEKRAAAERKNTTETNLSKLDDAIGRTGDSAAQRVYNKLFKSVRTGKLRSLEKQMREANKSKKMSAEDKEARIDKLEQQYNNELERISKAREKVKPKVEEELKRLEPKIKQAAVKERLAEIREEQAAITKKLDKDKREAKRVFKGEELKEYVAGLKEEAEAKRAALRDEIAELRGEKKKAEPTVEEEVTPETEEAPVEEDERIAKERVVIQRLEKKLAQAKSDLKAYEDRGAKKAVIEKAKKAVADIEFDIQDRNENIKELEQLLAPRRVVNEQPTVGTIRTKVGVEAFGKLEAAVRKAVEYYDEVRGIQLTEDGKTQNLSDRAKYAALSRKENAVSKLADELGLTDAERAVVLNSVREKIEAEQRAAEAKETEAAELKAAAERAKEAAETTVEEEVTPEAEPTVDDAEVARLEEELRQAEEDLDFYNRDEPDNTKYPKYKSFKQAKEAINAGKDPRFKGKEDNPTFPAQGANENREGKYMAPSRIPYITGMETTRVFEDSARAALESINRTYRATKSRDTTGVGQELEDTVEDLKKRLAEAKGAEQEVEKPTVSEAEKRAALDDITVQEAEKKMEREAAEAKLNVARSEQRKLDALKGKKDKKSVAERKNIKQFIEDLKTMSVAEARAKRTPKAREQRVDVDNIEQQLLDARIEENRRGDAWLEEWNKQERGEPNNEAEYHSAFVEAKEKVGFLKDVEKGRVRIDDEQRKSVIEQLSALGGDVRKGELIREDEDLAGVYEVEVDGMLFRGVSLEDFNRIQESGFIDTDLRGVISEKEGINLAQSPQTSFYYLPMDGPGVVMAIDVSDKSGLFAIGADRYVRSSKPIPASDIKFVTNPNLEGYFMPIVEGEAADIEVIPFDTPKAREQRVARMDDGPPRFNQDGLPEVRVREQRALWEDATPEKIEKYFEEEQYSVERSVVLGLANTPDVRLWFMRGGFLYGYDTPDGPVAVARIGIENKGGKAYLDLLEILVDEKGEGRSRGAGTRFMQEFTAVLDELNLGAELLAYPPRWYQDTMRGNEIDAVAERLVDFYSKFGFVRKREGDTSMTREPGAQPVVFDEESREDARRRNRALASIQRKKADLELAEKLLYNSFEELEGVLSPSQKSQLEEVLERDPFDLQFGELTEEQIDRVQAEFSEVPVSDEMLIDNFDDLLEFAELVKEEMDELESMQMLDPSPTKTAQEMVGQRERKLGELEDKGLALEHILAVNEAEYGPSDADVYNQYETYLEGSLDEADKQYLSSLAIGIDVETGRVSNASNLYDVFLELQDVREERNELESGFGAPEQPFTAREQRTELSQSEIDERNAGVPESRNMPYKDAPSRMYHVTFAGKAIRKAGKLLASSGIGTGGIGGTESVGVSFYDNASDAEVLRNELDLISRANAIETEEEAQAFIDRLQESKGRSFQENYNLRRRVDDKVSDSLREVLRLERMRVNGPVIFREETLPANQSAEIIEASKEDIPESTRILRGADKNEVRVLSNVTVREQRVADVVERYEFRPNGSLKNASLAGELRRNLKRYGFGVKQFGTRMDDFHIVNLKTGRKVDPKKLIAKDRADEKVEMKRRVERDAKERMEREEVEEAKARELQEMQDQYVDFPEEMLSAPSRLSPRQQRESLQDNAGKFDDAALVKFAKERGYSDAAILKVRPTAQAAIDAYDARATRLSREVQGIIQKARARARGDKKIQAIENKGQRTRAVNDRIIKDVKAYIGESKMYEEASDVGREAMMRAVDKQMGRRIKAAPSVIKLLGTTPDGDVLIDKKGLLEQIRAMARSSKATAAASREIMREVGKDIARLKATGTISSAKATAILRKMANMDPFNPVQVENFVNYTARVFAEAEYVEEVGKLNRLRKRALKNASKKLGISPDLMPMLQTLLNIDARLVPENVFEKYKELVNDLGERKTVLNLKERTQMFDDVVAIMSGINEELAKKEELFARYEAFQPKGDSVAATINAMVDEGVISAESTLEEDGSKTPSEADILLKYANELKEERKMSEEEKEKAREEERTKLIDAIQRLPKLDRKFPTQMENKLVRRFNKLVRTAGLLELSNADLKNVLRVADNIQNGFLPHTAQVLVEQVEANNRTVEVSRAIKEAKLPRIARVRALLDGVTRGSTVEKVVNRNPLRFIDQVYGNYTGTTIYDAAFKDLASGYASYKSDIMGVEERLDRVEQKLMRSLGRNPNAVVRSKFLIGAYMMQAEFDTNPDVSGVFDAVSLLDSTIKNSKQKKGEAFYNDATIKVLEDLRKKIDGKSAEEIRALLSKEEKAVADEVRAINDELTPKAEYVAGVLRGVPFRPFSQYFHRVVLNEKDKAGLRGVDALIDEAKARMRKPSTKAQNIQKRTTTSPPPVNFDPFASARRGARYILTDYHMTEAVRTNARLMNKLRGTEMNSKQRKFFDALDSASETAVTDSLVQSYTFSTWMEKAFEWAKRQSYRMVLFDVARTGGELISNLLFITVAAGRQFAEGVSKHFRTMSNDGGDIMRNVGSVQTTRLYADTKTISSRMVESLRSTTGPERGDVNHPMFNRLKQIWAYSGAPWQGAVGKLADIGITAPDKAIMRPVWFGTFALEFKNRTGQEVDFDKIAANDEAYMAANEEAIQAATDAADLTSIQAGATDNPFLGIVSSMRKAGGESSSWMALYRAVNNYMIRFLVHEYVTMRTATKAAVGNGTISPAKGARLMGAVTLRMVAYVMVTKVLRDVIQRALRLSDDEDDETFEEEFTDAVRQAFVSLGVGGTRGSLFRAVINTAIEYKRASMMEENGLDYTYEDGVFIPLMSPAQDGRPYKKMADAVARASGPYNPMVRTTTLFGRLMLESDKKTAESIKRRADEFNRLGLEALGMMGLIPFYKDLRNIMIKDIYKNLDKEDTPENIEKRVQDELLKARKEARAK